MEAPQDLSVEPFDYLNQIRLPIQRAVHVSTDQQSSGNQFMTLRLTRTQPSAEPEELSSMQNLAPHLADAVVNGQCENNLASKLLDLFPGSSFIGAGLLAAKDTLLMTSNLQQPGPLKLSLVPLQSVANRTTAETQSSSGSSEGSDSVIPASASLPPTGPGSLLCVPIRCLGSETVSRKTAAVDSAAPALSPVDTAGRVCQQGSIGVLILVVSKGRRLEWYLARLATLSQMLAPLVTSDDFTAKFKCTVEQLQQDVSGGTNLRLEHRLSAAILDILGSPAYTTDNSAAFQETLKGRNESRYSSHSFSGFSSSYHYHNHSLKTLHPCTTAEIQQLLTEILESNQMNEETVAESQTKAAADTAPNTKESAEVSAVLDPDVPRPGMQLLRPEDKWFEQHWLWLNYKDPELEKRFNWWHNRQCVKLDSGFCWFYFTLLVGLLTVEPYSLAKYHPNAFPSAFLIVPGVYILHRWDTDWYIKRRHAVIMVQTTYYMVYMVIFIIPVFLQVKPRSDLRRPLWLLRITGVECMLMQLCFQVPFEKFFWLGILHLGIVSSLQRSICEKLYADSPYGRCTTFLTGLQFVVGFLLTMLIARFLEKWRRKSFLKHVRAERPDPKALAGRKGRKKHLHHNFHSANASDAASSVSN